jgi:hypothetical protein
MAMNRVPVKTTLAIAITGLILTMTVLVSGLFMTSQRIPNTGNVKAIGVGVYWNSTCTSNVTSIDWNSLEPGASANRTVYIKNKGNTRVTLNMATGNWSSGAYGKITLSWNREGYLLDPSSVIQAVLTLSVSSTISEVTSFSFDITITGTEHA